MDELLTEPSKERILQKLGDKLLDALAHSSVLVALSGGRDSTTLLRLLHLVKDDLDLRLHALHVNYGLRGEESDGDQYFCESFCSSLGVSLEIEHGAPASSNLQAHARNFRYEKLKDIRTKLSLDWIATAHHLEDGYESLMIGIHQGRLDQRLLPIPPIDVNFRLVRPLACFSKSEIDSLVRYFNHSWREDSSNQGEAYLRNKVRHKLLPFLNRDSLKKLQVGLVVTEEQWEKSLMRFLESSQRVSNINNFIMFANYDLNLINSALFSSAVHRLIGSLDPSSLEQIDSKRLVLIHEAWSKGSRGKFSLLKKSSKLPFQIEKKGISLSLDKNDW